MELEAVSHAAEHIHSTRALDGQEEEWGEVRAAGSVRLGITLPVDDDNSGPARSQLSPIALKPTDECQ